MKAQGLGQEHWTATRTGTPLFLVRTRGGPQCLLCDQTWAILCHNTKLRAHSDKHVSLCKDTRCGLVHIWDTADKSNSQKPCPARGDPGRRHVEEIAHRQHDLEAAQEQEAAAEAAAAAHTRLEEDLRAAQLEQEATDKQLQAARLEQEATDKQLQAARLEQEAIETRCAEAQRALHDAHRKLQEAAAERQDLLARMANM